MNTTIIAVALAGLISLSACSGDSDSDKVPTNTNSTAGNSNQSIKVINEDLRKISFDVTQANSDGFIDVAIGTDDVSLSVSFAMADSSKSLLITEIRDPNNSAIYRTGINEKTGDLYPVVSEFSDTHYAGEGSTAFFLPPTPSLALSAGSYRFTFMSEEDSPLRSATALIKSAPAGQSIDALAYSADLNIWIAHPDPAFSDVTFKQLVETEYKDSINSILAPHSLSVDSIAFYKATDAETARFADLDVEGGLTDACLAMLPVTENKLALNLVYVRELTSPEGGGPAGVSSLPGSLLDDAASDSCFFVSQLAYAVDPSGEGFSQEMSNQMMAGNILHEAGHFMSLKHPTEEDGQEFDFLSDTPQCDAATYDGRDDPIFGIPGELDGIVDDFECGIEGGAKNYQFYSGVPHFLPFEMTLDQAKVLRRHPLFSRKP